MVFELYKNEKIGYEKIFLIYFAFDCLQFLG
jgi:hypothetical protein